jgi:hypothetical protein
MASQESETTNASNQQSIAKKIANAQLMDKLRGALGYQMGCLAIN